MKRGYDAKTHSIDEGMSVSFYIPIAKIPKYQNDGVYTQNHDYIIRVVEEAKPMNIATIAIFTSNSSSTISAYYIYDVPNIKVIINDDGDSYGIYVKPNGAYGRPIGIQVLAGGNPASIVVYGGETPRVNASTTLTNPVNIGIRMGYCKHNSYTLKSMDDVASLISSTDNSNYNYDVQYNTYGSADRSITPSDSIGAVWFIHHECGGVSGVNSYAIQTWKCIVGSVYHEYVRQKTDISAWGDFIKIH